MKDPRLRNFTAKKALILLLMQKFNLVFGGVKIDKEKKK